MSDTKIYSVAEAAELLHCSTYTIGEHCRSGKYPGIKVGRSWVLPANLLMSRIEELSQAPRARAGVPVSMVVPKRRSLGLVQGAVA